MPQSLYEQITAQRAARYGAQEADNSWVQNAPNAGAGWAGGLISGYTGRIREMQAEKQLQIEDSKNNFRSLLDTIPVNEHNFPLVLRLRSELDGIKPTRGSLMDIISRKPDPNEEAITKLYGVLRNAIPNNSNQGTPAYNKPNPIAQIGVAAGNMNMAGVQRLLGDEAGAQQTLATPAPQAVDRVVATGPDPNKFMFEEQGQFQPVPGAGLVHSAKTGTSHSLVFNKKTGRPEMVDLGQDFRTPAEIVAETRAASQQKIAQERTKNPVFVQMLQDLGFASMADIGALLESDPGTYAKAYQEAKAKLDQAAALKTENTQSNIRKNNAIANSTGAIPPAMKIEGATLSNELKRKQINKVDKQDVVEAGKLSDVQKADLRILEQDLQRYKKTAEGLPTNGLYPTAAAKKAAATKVQELEQKRQQITNGGVDPVVKAIEEALRGGGGNNNKKR